MSDENAVVNETTENVEAAAEAQSEKSGNGSRRRRKNKGGNRKGKRAQEEMAVPDDPLQVIKARFAACGRCCYFLGSYTSSHGEGELETAVQNTLPEWLTLTWDQQTRHLVHKAFGVQLDVDYYMYEGCCVACYRQFSLRTSETEGAVFRVQL
ncbi:MAG: hypothetical protein H6658_06715 [Ardenticatenaceae bacterium]|nr:hypothetical protein [Ardenticatenaceae bacterium]